VLVVATNAHRRLASDGTPKAYSNDRCRCGVSAHLTGGSEKLQTIGYDVGFCRGTGQYLFDHAGVRYLDLLSGWGVFGIGRNHPKLREALTGVLPADFPNLVT
jgi:4-aminobutyrate aminotransferase-like enzyme